MTIWQTVTAWVRRFLAHLERTAPTSSTTHGDVLGIGDRHGFETARIEAARVAAARRLHAQRHECPASDPADPHKKICHAVKKA